MALYGEPSRKLNCSGFPSEASEVEAKGGNGPNSGSKGSLSVSGSTVGPSSNLYPGSLGCRVPPTAPLAASSGTPVNGARNFFKGPVAPEAGVLAIKADGDCCFHLCGAIGALSANEYALEDGWAPCRPSDTAAARKLSLANIAEYAEWLVEFYPAPELEVTMLTNLERRICNVSQVQRKAKIGSGK